MQGFVVNSEQVQFAAFVLLFQLDIEVEGLNHFLHLFAVVVKVHTFYHLLDVLLHCFVAFRVVDVENIVDFLQIHPNLHIHLQIDLNRLSEPLCFFFSEELEYFLL